MKCPRCGKEMTRKQMKGILYDVCEDCKVRKKAEAAASEPLLSQASFAGSVSKKPPKKRRPLIVLSCAALLLVLAAGIYLFHFWGGPEQQGNTTFLERLPAEMKYSDNTIDFISVDLYQESPASGHGYHIFAAAAIDLSSLTENELHQIRESYNAALKSDYELTLDIYVDDEKNGLEHAALVLNKIKPENDRWIFCFQGGKEYPHGFSDATFSAYVSILQGESYKNNNQEASGRKVKYCYQLSGKSVQDISFLPDSLSPYMTEEEHSGTASTAIPENTQEAAVPESSLFPAASETLSPEGNPPSAQPEPPVETARPSSSPEKTEVSPAPSAAVPVATAPPAATVPPAAPTSAVSVEYSNALDSARRYLEFTAFSHSGLVEQLKYEGYSPEAASYAADHCGADWNQQALLSAQNYLNTSSFSYTGLVEQLKYEGFTADQAAYGVNRCGADWNQQAAKTAQNYLKYSSFSRQGLLDQLIYEGFTAEQAEFGVSSVGY